VALAGILAILLAVVAPRMPERERSLFVLMGIAVVGMVVTQLSGCFFTADCISSEKREGTLGLLFLTPLRSLDLVLGKLASHSLLVFFSMLALGPVLFIPLLNGGVTSGEAIRVIVTLIVSLFLSLSVGVLVSTLGRDAKTTVIGTLIVLVLINGLPLIGMSGWHDAPGGGCAAIFGSWPAARIEAIACGAVIGNRSVAIRNLQSRVV
jgi:ABC-type transport system involved in multi-copper enzyme maturation permease subunit